MSKYNYLVNKFYMKKFLIILQIFIKCILIFLIAFIWSRYVFKDIWKAVFISIIIASFIELILYLISKKNNNKKHLKINEKETAENMFLSLSADLNQLEFFFNLVSTRHKDIIKRKRYIKIMHEQNFKVILFPLLKFQQLQIDDINNIVKECKNDKPSKLVIVCNAYDKICYSFSKNFDFEIIILDKYETYSQLYKEYEYFPKITFKYKKETKKTFKELIAYSFNKTRAKGYIISAIIIFISSLFVKANLYYCIVSSILLIFALLSYTNPKYNFKTNSELL